MFYSQLKAAIDKGVISKPSLLKMPEGAPLHVGVCTVELRDGTHPPSNVLGKRVATGVGNTKGKATQIAAAEAVERYSLQYSNDMPEKKKPFHSTCVVNGYVETAELAIGSPLTRGRISTIGAAAGETIETASRRAVLELFEHLCLDKIAAGSMALGTHSAQTVSALQEVTNWLETQLRMLRLYFFETDVGLLVVARCSDFNGARVTEGTAFSGEFELAATKASREAIVSWRNMVALEQNGIDLHDLSEEDASTISIYRGAKETERLPLDSSMKLGSQNRASEVELDSLINCLRSMSGKDVGLFDFTVDEIRIPVVKAVFL